MAGSHRLTDAVKAALRRQGDGRVAPPEDVLYGPSFDLLNPKVYERKKKEAKQRECFLNHYAPVCRKFTYAQGQYQQRSMEAPYGDDDRFGAIRDNVIDDSKLAVKTARLCAIHHQVGAAFTIEHVWPTPMLQFQSFQELLRMPGVFAIIWDNCAYGERYRHRQVLITN